MANCRRNSSPRSPMNLKDLFLPPLTLIMGLSPLCLQSAPLPETPVPVTQPPSTGTARQSLITPPSGENQKIHGSHLGLVSRETARALTEKFRSAYGQATSPRIVIHVSAPVET